MVWNKHLKKGIFKTGFKQTKIMSLFSIEIKLSCSSMWMTEFYAALKNKTLMLCQGTHCSQV